MRSDRLHLHNPKETFEKSDCASMSPLPRYIAATYGQCTGVAQTREKWKALLLPDSNKESSEMHEQKPS